MNQAVILEECLLSACVGNFSKMKRLITETKHKIEAKYVKKIKFHGSYNIWLASNDPVPINLGKGDGRYHVIRIEETPQELLAEVNNPNYYKDLFKLLENKDFLNKAYDYFNNYPFCLFTGGKQ